MSGADFWKAFGPVAILLILFVVVFFIVYNKEPIFSQVPSIDVISGTDIVTDQAEVPITGVVSNTKALTVAGQQVAVSDDGGFSTTVPVAVGTNSIEIVGGEKKKVSRTTVRVTREEVQKEVIAAVVPPAATPGTDLADSGPVETAMGSFGIAALIMSAYVYRRSLRVAVQRAY